MVSELIQKFYKNFWLFKSSSLKEIRLIFEDMDRVKFKQGEQRKFLDLVVERLGSVSLRGILQFGFDVKYSSLKNYYIERRLMDRDFFEDLCHIAKLDVDDLHTERKINFSPVSPNLKRIKGFGDVEYVESNWGQVKGGKRGRGKV